MAVFANPDFTTGIHVEEDFDLNWSQAVRVTTGNPTLLSMTVSPASITAEVGDAPVQLTVTGHYDHDNPDQDITNDVAYLSNQVSSVPVSATGEVSFISAFSGTIAITLGNITQSISYDVTSPQQQPSGGGGGESPSTGDNSSETIPTEAQVSAASTTTTNPSYIRMRTTIDKSTASDFSTGEVQYSRLMQDNLVAGQTIQYDAIASSGSSVDVALAGYTAITGVLIVNKSEDSALKVQFDSPEQNANICTVPAGRYMLLAEAKAESTIKVETMGTDAPVEVIFVGE